MKIAGMILILSICLHTVFSDAAIDTPAAAAAVDAPDAAIDKPAAETIDKPATATAPADDADSSEESEEKTDGSSTTVAPNTNATAAAGDASEKLLTVSGSDTVELKAEHKDASSDEKLGTSSTIPVGFTSNGLIYSSPFRTSPFAGLGFGLGIRPFAGGAQYQGGYRGDQFQAGGHGYNQQILPKQGQFLRAPFGGYRNAHQPAFGTGQYLGQGQHLASHAQVVKGYPVLQNPQPHGPAPGYGGVAYAGHGAGHEAPPPAHHHPVAGYGEQHVTVNKQTELGVGPYGEVHRGDTIQKTVNTVEGATPIGAPFSPYGHGGVVYMGNGHISEHAAGVHTAGPVQVPAGYQQQNVAIHKQSSHGPYGEAHGGVVIQKEAVNSLGHGPPYPDPSHQQLQPEFQAPGYQIGSYQQQEHGIINKQAEPIHAYNQEHAHHVNKEAAIQKAAHTLGGPAPPGYQIGSYQQQEHGLINKQVEPIHGYDQQHAHHVNKEVAVQKATGTLGGPNPGAGLGYNGQENHAIAHQDQAFAVPTGVVDQGPGSYDSSYNQDPYFNNQVDPIYRKPPPPSTLLTTGPNRYYQGKNPEGVYEQYRRLG